MTLRESLRLVFMRKNLRRTLNIAVVVGTILTLINQGSLIFGGDATTATWIRSALNYCVPFVVSNLGLLAGKRAEAEPEQESRREQE